MPQSAPPDSRERSTAGFDIFDTARHKHLGSLRLMRFALVVLCALSSIACGSREVTKVATEADAIEILDVLHQNDFDAEKIDIGEGERRQISIVVSESWFGGDEAALARQVLRDSGLPRPADKGLEGAYEGQGLMPSESAQTAQRLKERETEIERQLRSLPNVVNVDVNIAPPNNNPLDLKPQLATASVIITHREPKFIASIEQIQQAVAGAVTNLPAERVSVLVTEHTARPVLRTASDARRRRNLWIAGGTGLLIVCGALALVFLLQTRRHKAQVAAATGLSDADTELQPFDGNTASTNAQTQAAGD